MYLPLPNLPRASHKSESIQIGSTHGSMFNDSEDTTVVGGKWEDEEERRFYEDVPDLKDYVPSSVLGIDNSNEVADDSDKDKEQQRIQQEKEDFRLLEEELQKLQSDQSSEISTPAGDSIAAEEDEYV